MKLLNYNGKPASQSGQQLSSQNLSVKMQPKILFKPGQLKPLLPLQQLDLEKTINSNNN